MKLKPGILLTLAVFVLNPEVSTANDGFGQLGAGGIVLEKTDDIAMAKEILDIGYDKITVEYEFVNESAKAIQTTVSFPLPKYPLVNCEAPFTRYPQPNDFAIWINAKKLSDFKTQVFAWQNGKDVTQELIKMGFTANDIALQPYNESIINCDGHEFVISEEQQADLKSKGLTKTYQYNNGKNLVDYNVPEWDVQIIYQWQQLFPAKSKVRVKHSYTPFVSVGTASDFLGSGSTQDFKPFCLTPRQKLKLQQLYAQKKNLTAFGVNGTIVDYILQTANSWKDGIRDFTLRIHTRAEDEIVGLCFDKKLTKVKPNLYEVKLSHYHPNKDLSVYFGNSQLTYSEFEKKSLGKLPDLRQ